MRDAVLRRVRIKDLDLRSEGKQKHSKRGNLPVIFRRHSTNPALLVNN